MTMMTYPATVAATVPPPPQPGSPTDQAHRLYTRLALIAYRAATVGDHERADHARRLIPRAYRRHARRVILAGPHAYRVEATYTLRGRTMTDTIARNLPRATAIGLVNDRRVANYLYPLDTTYRAVPYAAWGFTTRDSWHPCDLHPDSPARAAL